MTSITELPFNFFVAADDSGFVGVFSFDRQSEEPAVERRLAFAPGVYMAYELSADSPSGRTAWVCGLETTPSLRRKGLATAMLRKFISDAKLNNVDIVWGAFCEESESFLRPLIERLCKEYGVKSDIESYKPKEQNVT